MKFFTVLAIALAISSVQSTNWAVIVAGSNGYWNYRHQADSCHAYQILKNAGYNPAQIIHFAYNDIANNSQNPIPGKIYNKPDGTDVYAGCVIDYSGAAVNSANYLAVLKGQSSASLPKVVNSTSADKVFLNFTDHGAPGLIAFPNDYLYAPDLQAALQYMKDNNKYSKLVYYLEACESGSMFTSLPTTWNIYATTAANATESSWGCYCGSQATVGGINIGSCLGDLYSVVWMEDSDKQTAGETLQAQFQVILQLVTQSHPQQYGDLTWTSQLVKDWINGPGPISAEDQKAHELRTKSLVNSRDIKLHYLINRHANEMSENTMNELNEEIMTRKLFDDIFTGIQTLHADVPLANDTDFDCYKDIISFFEAQCGRFTEYGMKYMRSFYDICANKKEVVVDAKKMVMESCSAGKLF
jgi:legumain